MTTTRDLYQENRKSIALWMHLRTTQATLQTSGATPGALLASPPPARQNHRDHVALREGSHEVPG
jgi:hypothetical protein